MVLARADPRRRAWAVPRFALPRRGLHGRARGGAARDGASGEGLRCSPTRVVGARADGAGTATTQTFSTTGRFGFAKPEHRRAQVSAGDASGPRPAGTGAQRPPCKSTASGAARALSQLARLRAAPGGHTARGSTRRCPPLDARATAPSDSLFSEAQTPCWELPHSSWWPPRSSTTGSRPTSTY